MCWEADHSGIPLLLVLGWQQVPRSWFNRVAMHTRFSRRQVHFAQRKISLRHEQRVFLQLTRRRGSCCQACFPPHQTKPHPERLNTHSFITLVYSCLFKFRSNVNCIISLGQSYQNKCAFFIISTKKRQVWRKSWLSHESVCKSNKNDYSRTLWLVTEVELVSRFPLAF